MFAIYITIKPLKMRVNIYKKKKQKIMQRIYEIKSTSIITITATIKTNTKSKNCTNKIS